MEQSTSVSFLAHLVRLTRLTRAHSWPTRHNLHMVRARRCSGRLGTAARRNLRAVRFLRKPPGRHTFPGEALRRCGLQEKLEDGTVSRSRPKLPSFKKTLNRCTNCTNRVQTVLQTGFKTCTNCTNRRKWKSLSKFESPN